MGTSKRQYYMIGVVIISFCLTIGYSVYIQNKYDKALESLLICSTTYYGKIDERLRNEVENSGIRNNLKENNVENNVENNKKKSFTDEVSNDMYEDLVKKAERNNIKQDELDDSLKHSGFNKNIKEAESKQGNSND